MPKIYNLAGDDVSDHPANVKGSSAHRTHSDRIEALTFNDLQNVQEVEKIRKDGIPDTKGAKSDRVRGVGFIQMYKYSSTPERVLLCFGLLCNLAGGCGLPVIAWYSSDVLNQYYTLNITGNDSTQQQYDAIIEISKTAAIWLSIIDIGIFVCLFFGMMFWVKATDKIVQRVRRSAFNNLVRQHMGFFDLNEPGTIITSLAEDCIKYQSGMGEKTATSVMWFAQMIAGTVLAFMGDWLLSLIAFCLFPITFIATAFTTKYIRKLTMGQLAAYGKAGVVAEETISAIRIVQAFAGENKQSNRYNEKLNDARRLAQRAGYFIALANCISFMMSMVSTAIIFWVGGARYLNCNLTDPGVLIQVSITCALALRSFSFIANNQEFITTARAAAASIYHYIECKSEIDSLDTTGEQPTHVSGELAFVDVHFEYPSRPDVPVLKGLTLTIPAGNNVALVGPSGCGKSTTIQLIQRYYDARKGAVKLDGTDTRKLNTKWLRQQIGVVAQEPTLFATTVAENIRFGRSGATHDQVLQSAKDADAHDFIMNLPQGYETVLNEAASLLSRGEKQRISLARALVRQPKVLLLDECTSALDTESEVVVQGALEKAARGRTTITISHRLSTVRNSDMLYIINEGILWEQGNHDALMARGGLYSGLVANQVKGMDEKSTFDDVTVDEYSQQTQQPSPLVSSASAHARQTLAELLVQENENEVIEVESHQKANLKRIFAYNKPETCWMMIGCISAVMFGFGIPALSILMGELFVIFRLDDNQEKEDLLFLYCPIMMGVVGVASIAAFVAFATLKYSGEWLTQRLRSDVFIHILRMEIGWFDRKENQVGSLTTQLANDASRVQAATGTVLVTLFSALSTLAGAVTIALVYGWKLGLPLLAYMPVTIIIGIGGGLISTKFSQWTSEASRDGGKIIAEVIDKIPVVASLTKEDYFEDRFNKFFEDLAVKEKKKAVLGGTAWGLTYFFTGGAYLLSFPYGLYRVAVGDIHPEDIIRILFGVAIATQELARLNVYATEFTRARSAAAGLFKVLDRPSQINPHDPGGVKPKAVKGEMEVKKCSFNYPTRQEQIVLHNFSMEVKRGQFIAIVGPSGSGKTTAITLFERFYDILGGEVTLDGVSIKDLNLDWLRSQISVVTQDPILFNIGLHDNIAFGDNTRKVSMEEIIEAAQKANIHNFIASLPNGYDTPAGNKGTQLSGGQKQRVSIARALVRNPKILLLDDAMSALDAESEKQVEVALETAREGRTTIMVSHRLSSILKADMIYAVDGGTVIEKGKHAELMDRRGYYYKLYQAGMGLTK